MDWEQMMGNWRQMAGRLREQFGKLTDSDLQEAEGKRDRLVGKLQERYGYSREEAERRLDEVLGAMGR